MDECSLDRAAVLLADCRHCTVFTGAGVSVESGIPPFRGEGGLWNSIDPTILELGEYQRHPEESWSLIKQVFFDFFGQAQPNAAHRAAAVLEEMDLVKAVITQNIDNLHQRAGSKVVYEFHGHARSLTCLRCGQSAPASSTVITDSPPRCGACQGLLKPDFVFFGEPIPEPACTLAFREASLADVFLVIGTSGEIHPACMIPFNAKRRGVRMIEVNTVPSAYTGTITDIFLQGPATVIMSELLEKVRRLKHC